MWGEDEEEEEEEEGGRQDDQVGTSQGVQKLGMAGYHEQSASSWLILIKQRSTINHGDPGGARCHQPVMSIPCIDPPPGLDAGDHPGEDRLAGRERVCAVSLTLSLLPGCSWNANPSILHQSRWTCVRRMQ